MKQTSIVIPVIIMIACIAAIIVIATLVGQDISREFNKKGLKGIVEEVWEGEVTDEASIATTVIAQGIWTNPEPNIVFHLADEPIKMAEYRPNCPGELWIYEGCILHFGTNAYVVVGDKLHLRPISLPKHEL